jgi:hypothetical protein
MRARLASALCIASIWAGDCVAAPIVKKPHERQSLDRIVAGRLYQDVRPLLIRAGYRPAPLRHGTNDSYCANGFCRQYFEALNCSGSGET